MDWDDLDPKKKATPKKNLEVMGVVELEEYISELEAEIQRVRGTISAKKAVKSGAEALFKK